jgi:hypothetical protein
MTNITTSRVQKTTTNWKRMAAIQMTYIKALFYVSKIKCHQLERKLGGGSPWREIQMALTCKKSCLHNSS